MSTPPPKSTPLMSIVFFLNLAVALAKFSIFCAVGTEWALSSYYSQSTTCWIFLTCFVESGVVDLNWPSCVPKKYSKTTALAYVKCFQFHISTVSNEDSWVIMPLITTYNPRIEISVLSKNAMPIARLPPQSSSVLLLTNVKLLTFSNFTLKAGRKREVESRTC